MNSEDLRLAVYESFAATGAAPSKERLALDLSLDIDQIKSGLKELDQQRHLVIDDEFRIVMAHPFSSVNLGFSVMGQSTLWWGGCAWDSFALPHLIERESEVLVATTCPNCSAALAWNANSENAPTGDEVAHFLIPTSRMWEDVVNTCGNQRIFCTESCIDQWLIKTGNSRGYVMNLETLWKLAANWYQGRLNAGYRRREPAEAKDYFRSVGLSGAFWGLEE
jgi:hypothetical protein